MREEKYIIDEKGQEKILEINDSIVSDKNNNLMDIPKKERYHRKHHNIIFINTSNNSSKNKVKIPMNISYRNSKNKINKKFSTSISPLNSANNSFLNDVSYYKNNQNILNKINNNYPHSNSRIIPDLKYNIKHSHIISNQTSPNQVSNNYKLALIEKTNYKNNRFYHEIKKLSQKKNKSNTIYHCITGFDGDINMNNTYKNDNYATNIKKKLSSNNIGIPYNNKKYLIKDNSMKVVKIKLNNEQYTKNIIPSPYEIKNYSNRNINYNYNNIKLKRRGFNSIYL